MVHVLLDLFFVGRKVPLNWLVIGALLAGTCAGCARPGPAVGYVGEWQGGDETLVVQRNGLAEGRLFGATSPRTYTWRSDGEVMRLTFGRIASDAVEYRGTIDEAGRLVVENGSQSRVLVRSDTLAP